MRWAAFGTFDVRRHPRVEVLIEGLRASGDDVVDVNEPLKLDTAGRVRLLRQPWRLPVFAGSLLRCWVILARQARRVGAVDAVLVGYLGHFDVRLARVLYRRTPIVLDHLVSASGTARDRGLAGERPTGLKNRILAAIDTGALARADIVVVDTREHESALPPDVAARAIVVPVGATGAWFAAGQSAEPHGRPGTVAAAPPRVSVAAAPPRLPVEAAPPRLPVEAAPPRLTVVFVGLFTPLHGTATLGAALAELASDDVDVTMVGSGQDLAACRAAAAGNPRVTWIDWLDSAELPALVSRFDVSLGIFGTTPKALNVVPTKVFQGAAAGCAIVTSDTPAQRRALGDAAAYVPPGDAGALADTLRALAADRAEVARLRAAARAVAVARYQPAAVVAPIRAGMASRAEAVAR